MTTRSGRLALGERGEDVLDIGLGGELDRRAGEAEALGAQADLRHRLLARDIDDAVAGGGERGRGLHQERRLADAGIAADQDGGAAHEAAAGDPVEFGDAGGDARRVLVSPDSASSGKTRPLARDGRVATGPAIGCAAPVSSTIVFQSPQASHLPSQRLKTAPQLWQMKAALRLANLALIRTRLGHA